MPNAINRTVDSPVKSPAQSGSKLRPITPVETDAWTTALRNQSSSNFEFIDLDEPHEYPFKDQDPVWVRTKEDNWCYGQVTGRSIRVGHTRYSKQGFYYPVNFGVKNHLRKYFAPMNGEIKPDTEEVRLLLRESGWLDDDDALTMDSSSSYTTD